jgi:hypothetical protein
MLAGVMGGRIGAVRWLNACAWLMKLCFGENLNVTEAIVLQIRCGECVLRLWDGETVERLRCDKSVYGIGIYNQLMLRQRCIVELILL